jgi:hypothetical protein
MLVHDVYITLKDGGLEASARLVANARALLAHHDGILFFAAGTRAGEGFERPVNDRAFDVALHIVFADRAAHDAYQVSPDHQRFVAEGGPHWKTVRVFDSDCG